MCVHACVRACVRASVRACMRVCVRAYMRACVRACVRACASACVPACVHACAGDSVVYNHEVFRCTLYNVDVALTEAECEEFQDNHVPENIKSK